MEVANSATTVWKSKGGEIPMADLSSEHLQKAYNSAEYRFMKYENLAIASAEKAALFEEKLQQLEAEAARRNQQLNSLTEKDQERFGILRNRRRVQAMI